MQLDLKRVHNISKEHKDYDDFKSAIDKIMHNHPETVVSYYEYVLVDKLNQLEINKRVIENNPLP